MSQSDYTYTITNFRGKGIIVVQDLNRGNKSVTNNIENVVDEISIKEKIADPEKFIIVFKDSTAVWDIYDYESGLFTIVSEDSWKEAVSKYMELRQKV